MAVSAPAELGALPPQNLDAEASVLGAILLEEQALDKVLIDIRLRPDDFYRGRHGLVFAAMLRLKEKPEPEAVDWVTVSEELRRANELEQAGGLDYVHSLPSVVAALGNVGHYAQIVKDNATLRRVLAATREIS